MFTKTLCALALLTSGSAAFAQNYNVELQFGQTMADESAWDGIAYLTENGSSGGIGISRSFAFAPNMEFGVEYYVTDFIYTNYPDISQPTSSLMVTADYNFTGLGNAALTPYLGGGFGAMEIMSKETGGQASDTVSGAMIHAGVRYAVTPTSSVFAEVRHMTALSDATFYGREVEHQTTSIDLGVRMGF